MTKRQSELVRDALCIASSFIARVLHDRGPIPLEHAKILAVLDRAIGAMLPKSEFHDPGAYARCRYCGRYTTSVFALGHLVSHVVPAREERCDCGKTDGWSGSFAPPDDDSEWSIGFEVCR